MRTVVNTTRHNIKLGSPGAYDTMDVVCFFCVITAQVTIPDLSVFVKVKQMCHECGASVNADETLEGSEHPIVTTIGTRPDRLPAERCHSVF